MYVSTVKWKAWYRTWFLTFEKPRSSLELLKNTQIQALPWPTEDESLLSSFTQPRSLTARHCFMYLWTALPPRLSLSPSHLKGISLIPACTCPDPACAPLFSAPFSVSPTSAPAHCTPPVRKLELASPVLWTLVLSKCFICSSPCSLLL